MKGFSFVPSPFDNNPTVTRHFSCHVVFILTVFFPTTSTVALETLSAQIGVFSNAIISNGWYEYLLRNLLTRSINETIFAFTRLESVCATGVFLLSDIITSQ